MAKESNDPEIAFESRLVQIACFGIVVWALTVLVYTLYFRGHPSGGPEAWGQFGDFLGGFINPIVGLATVVLVALSISIQRKELRATTAELEASRLATGKMAFEQSLFSWLASYDSLISPIEIHAYDPEVSNGQLRTYKGRAAIKRWLFPMSFASIHLELGASSQIVGESSVDAVGLALGSAISAKHDDLLDTSIIANAVFFALNSYKGIYTEHQSDLGVLFRTLYRLVSWIDSDPNLSQEQKWHYAALVRARLSHGELLAILFQMLDGKAKRFAVLADKYSLFDNAGAEDDLVVGAAKSYISRGWQELSGPLNLTERAFDSNLGRKALGLAVI